MMMMLNQYLEFEESYLDDLIKLNFIFIFLIDTQIHLLLLTVERKREKKIQIYKNSK